MFFDHQKHIRPRHHPPPAPNPSETCRPGFCRADLRDFKVKTPSESPQGTQNGPFSWAVGRRSSIYFGRHLDAFPKAPTRYPIPHSTRAGAGTASDPRISLHPRLVRSAPREASAAPQDAHFSLKVKARWPDLICPAKRNPAKSPTRDGVMSSTACSLEEVLKLRCSS